MPARRKMPSDSILEKWIEEGLDHEQIRQRIKDDFNEDVAISSVSGHMSRIGATNRIKYSDWIPWARISLDHNHHYTLNMLRIGARLDRDIAVRDIDKRRFDRWSTELHKKKLVVHYDYNTMEGFFYVKRRPKVDGMYVRNPRKP